ncbi:MAG: 30S ribosomal protein S9, partial [Haloarculaceae archaeon]
MVTNTSGKKKTAIARATISEGAGRVRVNARPVELAQPELARLKMLEPFRIGGEELREDVDVDVVVEGGGRMGQADATRTAIARGLVQHTNDAELRDAFMEFDRSLLVNDVRQSESKKWGGPG